MIGTLAGSLPYLPVGIPRPVPLARERRRVVFDRLVLGELDEFPSQAARVHDGSGVGRVAAFEVWVPRRAAAVERRLGRVEAEPL